MEQSFSTESVVSAFESAPKPDREDIAPHQCDECERIRSDFSRYSNMSIPGHVVEYHYDSLPLLSPNALRYFLPSYLVYSCEQPSSNAAEFVLYHLAPEHTNDDIEYWDERRSIFTQTERQAIVAYLKHRQSWDDSEFYMDKLLRGIEYWSDVSTAA